MDIFSQIAGMGANFSPVTSYAQGQQIGQQNALARLQMGQMKQENATKNALLQLRTQLAVADQNAREGIINNLFAMDPKTGADAKKFYGVGGDGMGEGGNEYFGNTVYVEGPDGNLQVFQLGKTAPPRQLDFRGGKPVKPIVWRDRGGKDVAYNPFSTTPLVEENKTLRPSERPGVIEAQAEAQSRGREIGSATGRASAGGLGLSPTAEKELFEADETAIASDGAMGVISRALRLNETAYSGYGASGRAAIRSLLPGQSPEADATILLESDVKEQLLASLKSTFGGNPTEGERAILLELGASTEKTPEQRKEILSRALAAAKRRKDIAEQKAQSLRSGTYFSEAPQRQPQPPQRAQPQRQQPPQAGPKPGSVVDGYVFLGGNPADPSRWKKAGAK